MWIYTREVLTIGHTLLGNGRVFEERMMSIMLCMNWVCVGTLEDHELVSRSTISQHVEMLDMKLDYGFDVPCVVHEPIVVFSKHWNKI